MGLSVLQKNAVAKEALFKEISIECTKLSTLIKKENFNERFNRRAFQIDKRNFKLLHEDSNCDKAKVFCYNGSSLTWKKALGSLPATMEFCEKLYDIFQLGVLMEDSAIIPVESVYEIIDGGENQAKNKGLVSILLKCYPLYYMKTVEKKEILVNIHQVTSGCDMIDQLLSNKNNKPHPETNENCMQKRLPKKEAIEGGQPSIVSKFPEIPEVVTEYVKRNGYKAQEKRRNDDFESCGVTVSDVRRHILEIIPGLKEHGISDSTVRYLFSPVHKGRKSSKRYKSLVKCGVPKKDNSLRKESKNAHYIHCRVAMRLEHAARFHQDYLVISADAMNKIHVGTLAVLR